MVNPRALLDDFGPQGVPPEALLAADVAMMITDVGGDRPLIRWVNPAFTRSTGYELSQVVGRDPGLLQGDLTDDGEAGELADAIEAGRAHAVTLLNYRADGSTFWNHVSAVPVHDGAGTITHWIGVQIDVSERVAERAGHEAALTQERRTRAGLTLVSQISELLSDLDDPYLLQQISSLLRHETVRWCEFFLDDGAGLHTASGLTLDPARHTRPRRADPVHGVTAPAGSDPVQELLDGTVDSVPDFALHGAYPPGTASAWLVDRIGFRLTQVAPEPRAVVLLPIRGRRRTLGVLAAVPSERADAQPADAATMTVLDLVAHRVGMAVENVRLYDREHRLAETLQRAMLPELADIPGLDVWTYYAPNAEHAQVGGDWYDVLELDQGVAAVIVGDVVGHDVEAAAAMGQLRSVVRAYAAERTAPEVVLQKVDQLVSGMRLPRSASMVYATLTAGGSEAGTDGQPHAEDRGGWQLAYSRAGHLPIVLVRDGQATTLLEPPGPLIGFAAEARRGGVRALVPGDVLLFYTDGLIERRDRALREGLAALLQAAQQVTAVDAAGIGEDLLTQLCGAPEDDVAIVVVRIPDPDRDGRATVSSPRTRRWVLASVPASIGRARQLVLKTCRTWGIDEAANAELVVSELVANAVLHGWGHVALQLFETAGALRIEVEDANPAPPVTTEGHPGRVGGYGMQIVERLADWGWWPSSSTGKVVWAKVRPAQREAAPGLLP